MEENLQQAESLDPRIEDLVKRIKEFKQLNGEQLRLEEVLRKKQETLKIFLLQCEGKESEAQRELFEEEYKKATEFLEAASEQHQQLQCKRQRLMAEMGNMDMHFFSEIHIAPEEGTSKEEARCLSQSTQELPLGPQETKSASPRAGHMSS
ncbi:synaptonemal complex central element protein 1-like isoform X2 [Dasypus novemcinctus]|uniref:synaptonemal complex central element protein 1-like isoform X2 n=1 Tax=Dasypus novemcinctus TaxID=9361 RepID=UPI00265FD2D0|nr:synaptonemal complex central element protein 1-like isoform X2 [Dasypus novemcinctus]XP_058147385.1 synaptonemal complex central element protein 1-like isoform X2 [Dasypus novemcinctus]XP_058147444.1 synaptonemal complex central element protein 1-like isoform X2 [Dasypus novemcinctus]